MLTIFVTAVIAAALGYLAALRRRVPHATTPPVVSVGPRPILVVGGRPGRHLFEAIHDERIRVVSAAETPEPDLLVFPSNKDRKFAKFWNAPLLQHYRERLSSGRTGIVFDGSAEPTAHTPERTNIVHAYLQELGVPLRNCVLITQDRSYAAPYREYCATLGVTAPINVFNYDYWNWYSVAAYEANGEEVYRERLAAFRARAAHRPRRFISLNRTARPAKVMFLLRLLRDGLWDSGFVSFGGFHGDSRKPRPTPEQLADALPGFSDMIADLAPLLDSLEARGSVLLGTGEYPHMDDAGMAFDLPEYQQSWFSIVTETEMRPRVTRITEKVIKPLVNFHPLLVLGNAESLRLVRESGFATFEEVFDESYDEEPDVRRRFDLVYAELVRLCGMDDAQLQALEARVTEKLIYNARWGLTRFPGMHRRLCDAALVSDMIASVEPLSFAGPRRT